MPPSSTNAVEHKNRDCKTATPQALLPALVNLYKMDKAICAKYIVAKQGHSISYSDQSEAKKQETAVKRKQQRKRQREHESECTGPPDKQGDFITTAKRSVYRYRLGLFGFSYRVVATFGLKCTYTLYLLKYVG